MKKNVELEFINKVRELSEKMQDLTLFWQSNLEELKDINDCKFSESLDDLTVSPEDTNVCKNYPTCETFDNLTLNIYSWLLTLINTYCEKDPIVFFDAYYKSLHK
jgi:hypothetical protein